jgi:hypothetical protein
MTNLVVSYGVATRTNEFGIRMALGANGSDVFRMVLASTAVNVVAGIILSSVFDKLSTRWVMESSRNPLILAGVTLILIAAAALACFVPARRACGYLWRLCATNNPARVAQHSSPARNSRWPTRPLTAVSLQGRSLLRGLFIRTYVNAVNRIVINRLEKLRFKRPGDSGWQTTLKGNTYSCRVCARVPGRWQNC